MKRLILPILLPLLVIIQFSCEPEAVVPPVEAPEEELIDLNGEWTFHEVECPALVYQDEQISISHNLETGEIIATKITGDDCVTAGNTTFTGILKGATKNYYPNVIFEATFILGVPNNPNSTTGTAILQVFNDHIIKGHGEDGGIITRDCGSISIDEKLASVPLINQPTTNTCWAASAAMMYSWKNQQEYSIGGALSEISYWYWSKFQTSFDLDDSGWLPYDEHVEFFVHNMGLTGSAMPGSISELRVLLQNHGPLLVVTDENISETETSAHIRVVTGIKGDGTPDCTYVILYDPWANGSVTFESLADLNSKANELITNRPVIGFNIFYYE